MKSARGWNMQGHWAFLLKKDNVIEVEVIEWTVKQKNKPMRITF